MNKTMLKYYEEAMASNDRLVLASAEIRFRKAGHRVCNIIGQLQYIREEYFKAMSELERVRLDLERSMTKVKQCKPRQSGKSKVKVELSVEQLLASLSPEQQAQLLETLQGCACAEV